MYIRGWRFMQLSLVVSAVWHIFTHALSDFTEVDKIICYVDQLWSSVRTKARYLDATAFVGNRIHRVNKILVAGHKHSRVVASRERKHVDSNLDIEIRLAGTIIESLKFFLNDAKTIAAHPKQKSLLALGPYINTSVKEGPQQATITQQNPQKLVVIDVDIMKASCVKKVIAVNENRYSATMSQLPGNIVSWIEVIHHRIKASKMLIQSQ